MHASKVEIETTDYCQQLEGSINNSIQGKGVVANNLILFLFHFSGIIK